jgi:hypothetical protein
MNHEKERPDLPEFLEVDEKRRSFIKKCMIAGGGMLLYLAPTVKAYAGNRSVLSHPGWFFDITLPAHFSVAPSALALNFAVSGQPTPIPVSMNVSGNMALLATANEEVATITTELVGLSLSSVSADPLGSAGVHCGMLTAALTAGSLLGQLNLRTGALTPAPSIQAGLSSALCGAGPAVINQVGGAVTKAAAGDHKCSPHDIQVQTACAPGGHSTTVTGAFAVDLRVA